MKPVRIFDAFLLVAIFAFSGCGRTIYENDVKIEKGGWFGSVEAEESEQNTQGS